MIDEVVQKTNVLVSMVLSATPDVFHKHTCIAETPNHKLLPSYKLVLTMTKSVLNFSKLLSGELKNVSLMTVENAYLPRDCPSSIPVSGMPT